MSTEKLEDVRDIATKLDEIYSKSPTDYAYLKGWIHCLLQKEQKEDKVCKSRKLPKNLI